MFLWWSDPEKKARLKEAKNNPNITLPTEDIIFDYYNMNNIKADTGMRDSIADSSIPSKDHDEPETDA